MAMIRAGGHHLGKVVASKLLGVTPDKLIEEIEKIVERQMDGIMGDDVDRGTSDVQGQIDQLVTKMKTTSGDQKWNADGTPRYKEPPL